jgi:hypothetical protein
MRSEGEGEMLHRDDDILRCHRCRQERPPTSWTACSGARSACRAERRRAGWWGRALGFAAAVALSFWIAIVIQPSDEFRVLWALVVIVAFYLLSRLGQELVFGMLRVRNVPGARAAGRGKDRPGGSGRKADGSKGKAPAEAAAERRPAGRTAAPVPARGRGGGGPAPVLPAPARVGAQKRWRAMG